MSDDATLRAVLEKWRKTAEHLSRNEEDDVTASVFDACADELEAAIVGVREPPEGPQENRESFREKLCRVQAMAQDTGESWDLSTNDQVALQAVLADRQRMAVKLNAALAPPEAPEPILCRHCGVSEARHLSGRCPNYSVRQTRFTPGDPEVLPDQQPCPYCKGIGYLPGEWDVQGQREAARKCPHCS